MKKAWIENARIRDVAPGNPADLYVPEIAQFYDTDVPDDAANGDGWVNGQLVKPEPPEVVAPAPQYAKLSPVQFMLLLTSAERVAIKAARTTDAVIEDWLDILEDPRLTEVDLGSPSIQDILTYLVSINLLTSTRKNSILNYQL